jgi:hypothetical protein
MESVVSGVLLGIVGLIGMWYLVAKALEEEAELDAHLRGWDHDADEFDIQKDR